MIEDAFERRMKEACGLTPQETRVFVRIAQRLTQELVHQLRGSAVENDLNGLLVLSRLTEVEQRQLVFYLKEGLVPGVAVTLASSGMLQQMLAEDRT